MEFATLLQQKLLLLSPGLDDNNVGRTNSDSVGDVVVAALDSSSSSLVASSLSTIYRDTGSWDNSPIVIEEYKLVFFAQPKVSWLLFGMNE